jgi:hypothetical protein
MAVPARPASGAPIDSVWGGVVHDEVVAQDIQAGTVSVVAANVPSVCVQVTFPRPFAAPPIVMVTQNGGASGWYSYSSTVTATGFPLCIALRTGVAGSVTVPCSWVAIGPRA